MVRVNVAGGRPKRQEGKYEFPRKNALRESAQKDRKSMSILPPKDSTNDDLSAHHATTPAASPRACFCSPRSSLQPPHPGCGSGGCRSPTPLDKVTHFLVYGLFCNNVSASESQCPARVSAAPSLPSSPPAPLASARTSFSPIPQPPPLFSEWADALATPLGHPRHPSLPQLETLPGLSSNGKSPFPGNSK